MVKRDLNFYTLHSSLQFYIFYCQHVYIYAKKTNKNAWKTNEVALIFEIYTT